MSFKTVETMRVHVFVLQKDIEEGKCGLPSRCMEKIAIERALLKKNPDGVHRVKIDGGRITYVSRHAKWAAFTPKLAKRALMRFDRERKARERAEKSGERFKSAVQPHDYWFEAIKVYNIRPFTKSDRRRLDQINTARKARAAAGNPDKRYDVRRRVEGQHTNVT